MGLRVYGYKEVLGLTIAARCIFTHLKPQDLFQSFNPVKAPSSIAELTSSLPEIPQETSFEQTFQNWAEAVDCT